MTHALSCNTPSSRWPHANSAPYISAVRASLKHRTYLECLRGLVKEWQCLLIRQFHINRPLQLISANVESLVVSRRVEARDFCEQPRELQEPVVLLVHGCLILRAMRVKIAPLPESLQVWCSKGKGKGIPYL
eukprot:351479-Chlamydomonas_euryale.AAC.11